MQYEYLFFKGVFGHLHLLVLIDSKGDVMSSSGYITLQYGVISR